MSILVVGSLAFDDIETPFGSSPDTLGGSSTYIALSASYFTSDINMVGVVGSDFTDEHFQLLHSRNINTNGIQKVEEGKTFRWAGRYHYDMNTRDTLDTQLNVFADFDPHVPAEYRSSEIVCLGNIDPELQIKVLDQITAPKMVICDTMNFWIEGKPEELKKTLERVDIFIINDSEARILSGDPNLVKSARIIRAMGPKILIIKKRRTWRAALYRQRYLRCTRIPARIHLRSDRSRRHLCRRLYRPPYTLRNHYRPGAAQRGALRKRNGKFLC